MLSFNFSKSRFLALLVLFILGAALVAACSDGGDDDDDADSSFDGGGAGQVAATPAAAESAEREADAADAPGSLALEASYVANQVPLDRLIIRTVTLSLTVEDVAQGTAWIRELAGRKGGFVFSSNTYVRDESEFAQITIRVPSDQLDSTVLELREHDLVLQVDSEESTSQDVSQEYVDNEARLEALEETQRRFLALLAEADSVDAILQIESELTSIRSQIETIKGRQNYLDQMTAFSTVTVTLHLEDEDVDDDPDGDDDSFIARIFGDSWDRASGVIEGLLAATITITLIALAIAPVALIVLVVGRFVYRRFVEQPTPVTEPAAADARE